MGAVLNSLFQQAIRVGKRVHTETGIGSAGRSLVSTAYQLLTSELGALHDQRVLVVGAGAMAGLAARTAAADGASVTCANRTLSRAERLAEAVGGKAVALSDLPQALAETDVLVTCTGARTFTIGVEDLAGTPVRGVVDLALPADVAPEVVEHGICLVNLDRLVTEQPDAASAQEVEDARALVREEVADFLGLRRATQVAPTVVALRSMASEVVASELRRLDARLPHLDDHERDQIQRSMRRIVDKLLHAPTVRVQELSAEPDAVDCGRPARALRARPADRRRGDVTRGRPQCCVGLMTTDHLTRPIRLGARTSALARAQANQVATALGSGGIGTTFVGITTAGDLDQRQLTEIGGTGVFVSAVRDALRRGEIDVAVHSLKDLPTTPAEDLEIIAIPVREDTRDVLVGRRLDDLSDGARVGTGLRGVPCKSSTGPPAMSFGWKLCRFGETSRPGSSGYARGRSTR